MMEHEFTSDELLSLARDNRVPIFGVIEMTDACNFKCSHCYNGHSNNYIDMSLVIKLIDRVIDKGCQFLLFTGGEPLMHPDFFTIYKYAYLRGLKIIIFTNGSLISEEVITFFSMYRPSRIEISIYGADEISYFRNTKNRLSYKNVHLALESLYRNKFNVVLKVLYTKNNYKYYDRINEDFSKYNFKIKNDYIVWPKLNYDDTPQTQQIDFEIIKSFTDINMMRKLKNNLTNKSNNKLFQCDAGLSHFYITSKLDMKLCIFDNFTQKSLLNNSFDEIWSDFKKYTEMTIDETFECSSCDKRSICGICPSWVYLKNKDLTMNGDSFHCNHTNLLYNLFTEKEDIEGKRYAL